MDNVLSWIGYGFATLVFVACVVAWYEHLSRAHRRDQARDWDSPQPRVAQVDLELEAPATASSDAGQRREALDGALSRMSSARTSSFCDTVPMVLPGRAPTEHAEGRRPEAAPTPAP